MHYFQNQNSLFDLEHGLNVSIILRMYFFIWEYDFFILENHFLILENDFVFLKISVVFWKIIMCFWKMYMFFSGNVYCFFEKCILKKHMFGAEISTYRELKVIAKVINSITSSAHSSWCASGHRRASSCRWHRCASGHRCASSCRCAYTSVHPGTGAHPAAGV